MNPCTSSGSTVEQNASHALSNNTPAKAQGHQSVGCPLWTCDLKQQPAASLGRLVWLTATQGRLQKGSLVTTE